MNVIDADEADVFFLHRHPAWTWDALQAAPDIVVEGMKLLDLKLAVER